MDIDTIIAQAQAVVDALVAFKNQAPVTTSASAVSVTVDVIPGETPSATVTSVANG